MKHNHKVITLALLGATSLFSCNMNNGTPIYYLDNNNEVAQGGTINIYHPKNNEVPYISLEEGVALASTLRTATFGEGYKYEYSINGDVATISDEKGTKATFDATKQEVTIDHYDSFVIGYLNNELPLNIVSSVYAPKSIKIVKEESSYTAGNALTLKLSEYPSINLEKSKEGLLIPVATFNDIFFSGDPGYKGIAYNYNNMYLSTGLRSIETGELTKIGKHYYSTATRKSEVSTDLSKYLYDEMMFALDNLYGLKGVKNISSFKALAKDKGLEEDMLSGNLEKMEDAYTSLLYEYLEDGHTAYLTPSAFTDVDNFTVKDTSKSQKTILNDLERKAMNETRANLRVTKPFEIIGDTAFIYFDDFMEMNETKLYSNITEQDIKDNNTLLFAYAYKQIKANPNVRNVVVDLVTNNGGDATGLVYCLGTLIGKHYIDTMNPFTGARSHVTYMTDINVDGVIDSNDVPLCNDYNIYMIDSKFAFSCGNLFPVAAKYNNENVTLLGDTTGGGTCVVSSMYNALGAFIIKSGPLMLTKSTPSGYTHIEDGATPDINVNYEDMLNRMYILNLIN